MNSAKKLSLFLLSLIGTTVMTVAGSSATQPHPTETINAEKTNKPELSVLKKPPNGMTKATWPRFREQAGFLIGVVFSIVVSCTISIVSVFSMYEAINAYGLNPIVFFVFLLAIPVFLISYIIAILELGWLISRLRVRLVDSNGKELGSWDVYRKVATQRGLIGSSEGGMKSYDVRSGGTWVVKIEKLASNRFPASMTDAGFSPKATNILNGMKKAIWPILRGKLEFLIDVFF